VTAELQLGPKGLTGTVANKTSMELKNCLMAINSYPFTQDQFVTLSPGESTEVTLNETTMKSRGDFTTDVLLGSASRTRKRIIEHLFTPLPTQPLNPWTRRLFFLGWPERSFISETLLGTGEQEPIVRSTSLLCVESIVRPAKPGEQVRIPRAFSIPALRPGRSTTAFRLSNFLGNTMPPQTGLLFYLPAFASNVRLARGDMHLLLDAYGYQITVRGVDQKSGERIDLEVLKNPSGRRTVEIPDASRFQDRMHGLLVLDLEARPILQPGEQSPTSPSTTASWGLQEASVSLEGVAE
jgi:hypothetical protein